MLIPELEDFRRQFERIRDDASELAHGLTERQFNWRPQPESWSICECLGHLIITGEAMRRNLDAAIETGRVRGLTGQPPFQYGGLERLIVRVMEPPPRLKVPAPRRLHPANGQPLSAVVPSFLHLQRQFIERIEQSNGLDLRRVKVLTLLPWMRMSLGMIFAQTAAHQRRHLFQARSVRRHAEFPKERTG